MKNAIREPSDLCDNEEVVRTLWKLDFDFMMRLTSLCMNRGTEIGTTLAK